MDREITSKISNRVSLLTINLGLWKKKVRRDFQKQSQSIAPYWMEYEITSKNLNRFALQTINLSLWWPKHTARVSRNNNN